MALTDAGAGRSPEPGSDETPRAEARSDGEGAALSARPTPSIQRVQSLSRNEGRARRIVALVPVCVFVVVFVVFAVFSRFMREQESERLELATTLTVNDVTHRLEQYVRLRLELLQHVRDDWTRGHVDDEASFRAHARDLQQYFQGIVAINWVDGDGVIRWLVPEDPNLAAKGRDLDENPVAGPVLARARATGRVHVTPPLDLYQGGRGFAVYVPIVSDGQVEGFVNGAFRFAPLVRECLAGDPARTHHYSIREGDDEIVSSDDTSEEDGVPYTVTRSIPFQNRIWTVTMRPTRAQMRAARSWADEIALVLGLIAALGLASASFRIARSRALVRTSRERYRSVVDDTPALICRYLPDGTITFVNVAYGRHVGKSPPDVIGTSFYERLPPESRAEARAALGALDADEPSRVYELETTGANGERSWQQWIDRALFDVSGAVVEFQSVGLDITATRLAQEELRRSEERFRTIFNAVADGIVLFDQDGEIQDANARACALLGLGYDELVGRGIEALRAAGADGLPVWLEHTASHGHFAAPELRLQTADGTGWQAELELRRTTIAGAPRIVAVLRDVTARAELSEQLRQSQKMEAMGTLAGGIAHDFNNILTAIMGHAEMARMTVDTTGTEARSLEGILAACEQATGVTRSLLTFSRKGDSPRAAVDLATLVHDTLRLLRPLLPGAIEITSEIDTAEALWVDADTSQVQQVLMNLALNARDAMPEGGRLHVELTCESMYDSARASREWTDFVVITVRDSGVGMTEEVRRRVVEPFFTTKTRERGTGLGMSVVHGIVTGHGGTLEIESEVGVGTTVRVTLPRRDAPPEPRLEAASRAVATTTRGTRALVVEDNGQVRNLLASVLTQRGFRVDEESDGAAAWESYLRGDRTWDLVVLDIDLPGMTGTECLRRMRQTGDDVAAILVSGNPEFARQVTEDDRTRFLQKPFTMREFASLAGSMTAGRLDAC